MQAYLEVAPQIASFPEYSASMRKHLLETKLRHWEPSLRELASKALIHFVHADPQYFAEHALSHLLNSCLDRNLEVNYLEQF